jgi:hypothetical protein
MASSLEMATESIEHTEHAAHADANGRRVALLIAALAAALALCEMGEKAAQNSYLTHHIQASDDWAQFQAKTIRMNMYALQADMLASLPNAAEPAQAKKITDARATSARMDDDPVGNNGRKQMVVQAKASEHTRDAAFHVYHLFERVVSGLQLSIVLASVSVVTRVKALAWVGGILGGGAAIYGALVALNIAH